MLDKKTDYEVDSLLSSSSSFLPKCVRYASIEFVARLSQFIAKLMRYDERFNFFQGGKSSFDLTLGQFA